MSESTQSLLVRRIVTLARWRRLILANTLVVAAASVVVSLVLPAWYRSTASVYPPQEETLSLGEGGNVAALAASALGRSRAGVSIFSSPSDIYVAILRSRSVREEIIRRHDLMGEFEVETMDEALEVLKGRIKSRVGSEGVVSLSVIDKDPEKAATIANDLLDLLDTRSQERRRTSAGAVRAFLERRVAETRDSLRVAEGTFLRVQKETGILAPEDQARALVESAVQIELGRKMREVELGILRAQVGPGEAESRRLAREIDLIGEQLRRIDRGAEAESASFRVPHSQFPARSVAFAAALRDLKIQEGLYELLTQQYETYRILELRDTPTLQVLDRAVPAEKRFRPIRWLICTIATGLAFLLSCLLAFILDEFARMRREEPKRWESLRAAARGFLPAHWFSSGHDPPLP